MDRAESELLTRSLQKAVEANGGAPLDSALEELGWRDALAADPAVAVPALFELQGAANVTSGALDDVLRYALGTDTALAVVLPELGQTAAPGRSAGGARGLGTAALARSGSAVVVAEAGDGHIAAAVPLSELQTRAVTGIDPAYGLVEVQVAALRQQGGTVDWAGAVALGQLALGHELVGASRRMLDLAREHALAREQFGRTISHYQAVRHRLADTLVSVESARAMLDAAWLDLNPVSAAMAKAVAGRSAKTAARHCQQVLAGMGFTDEHPFHRHLRRVLLLDQLLGASERLTRQLGEQVVRTRRLPEPVAL